MEVIEGLDKLPLPSQPRGVCVGALDGFHVGHQYLISRLCALCAERDYQPAIVTFEPIPAQFFSPANSEPRRLITREERIWLAQALCCEMMLILPFDAELARWSAERFMREVLLEGMQTQVMMASSNHVMGHDRADMAQMKVIGDEMGIESHEVPLLQLGDFSVSSSQIRHLLWEGRVEEAAELLGRHYVLGGIVRAGRGVGHHLGFPTANLEPWPAKLIPGDGVYAALASVPEDDLTRAFSAAVSVGKAPTFELEERVVEAHLITDEPLELVGKELHLQFIHRLREQRKFADRDELSEQIAHDVQKAEELCGSLAKRGISGDGVFCPAEKGS